MDCDKSKVVFIVSLCVLSVVSGKKNKHGVTETQREKLIKE